MRNKFGYIIKALATKKNRPAGVLLVWGFSSFIFFSFLHLINVFDLVSISAQKDMFGRYSAEIPYSERIETIKEDTHIKDYLCAYNEIIEDKEDYLVLHHTDERILDFTNLSLIEGKLPEHENEIAVERRYMHKNGIPNQEMIGSKIVIGDKEYTVTGIMIKNSCFENGFDSSEYRFVIPLTGQKVNTCYIELVDLENYKSELDYLCEKYDIEKEKCYVNLELFASLGYLSGDANTQEYALLYVVFIIMMIVVVHTLNNYVKIWMNNIADDIANMGILGIDFSLMATSLFIFFAASVLVSILIGGIAAFGVSLVVWKVTSEMVTFNEIIQCMPVMLIISIIILYCIIALLQMSWLLIPLIRCNVSTLKNEGNILLIGKKFRFRKHYLSNRTISFVRSMIKKNNADNIWGRFSAGFGITIATILFSVGLYFSNLELKAQGYKNDMDYKVMFEWIPSTEKEERRLQHQIYRKVKNTEGCQVYPEFSDNDTIKLTREELGDEYLRFLWEIVDKSEYKFYKTDKEFDVDVMIIGYDKHQLNELYSINGLDNMRLESDEVIVLNTTVPIQGGKGFDINIKDTVTIGGKTYKVKSRADKLLTYEKSFYDKICIVVNETTYCSMFNVDVPENMYIKVADGEVKSIVENILIGNDVLQIEEPKKDYQSYENGARLVSYVVITIVLIMLLPVFVSVLSNMLLRFHINKTEYQLFNVIGISKNKSIMIFLGEIVQILFWGVVVSFPFTYLFTREMMYDSFGKAGLYYYSFPIGYYKYILIFLAIMVGIISVILKKKIKSIGLLRA